MQNNNSQKLISQSKKATLLVSTIAASLLSMQAFADTLIHAGTLIPADSNKVQKNVTVVVDGNSIKEIKSGFIAPGENDTLIDLSDYTLMPGLMDMHTHLTFEHSGPSTYLERFILNEADYTIQAVGYAKTTLEAGFTSVRNLGDGYNETVALRKAINKGAIPGPRVFTAAKSIATTGGHADPSNGQAKIISTDPGPKQGVINGVAEARKAVRQRYKDGADLIKITATGGVLSVAKSGQNPQFMDDELKAIVDTARDYGLTVAVHAHGKEGMRRAINAGVNSIEHGTYMDKEIFRLMKKNGTYYVPTIMAGNWVAEKSKIDGFFPELVRPKAAKIGPLLKQTFAAAYKAGVNIAFGTDSGVSAHGDNGLEFVLMVEAGMKPIEAIRSATYHGAVLLNELDRLGTIEPGKLADMVAVKGDPLADISEMQDIDFVMKDGKVYLQK